MAGPNFRYKCDGGRWLVGGGGGGGGGWGSSACVARAPKELCEEGGGQWALIPYPIFSLSLINHTVSMDVKHHERRRRRTSKLGSCVKREVGLGCHSLSHSSPVPNKPHGFCRRQAPWKKKKKKTNDRAQELCESRGGRPGLPSLINLRFLGT